MPVLALLTDCYATQVSLTASAVSYVVSNQCEQSSVDLATPGAVRCQLMAELLGNDVPASTVQRLWLRVHAVRRGRALLLPCSCIVSELFHQSCCSPARSRLFHHMQVPLPLVSVETVMQGTASGQSCFVSGTVCAATSVGCCTSLRLLLCPFCDTQQAVLPGRALPACTGTCMHHACIVVVSAVHQESAGSFVQVSRAASVVRKLENMHMP